ncbi:ATP-binding protein [Streptomyces sp. NPDC048669]|uniref:ATP-binding protein n=1 Tax=Streptomyces sp. NPDC048669 TaxID=3155267 RepID=UPI0034196BEE
MPHTRITFTVEATEAAVHGARHRVSTAVRRWGGPVDEELCFHLELVASELLTNGLRHAGGPMTAEVTLVHDLVVVAVLDGCPELPRSRPTQIDDECGRGLALIEDLCLIQGAETTPDGKRCWAVLPVRTACDPAVELVPGGGQANGSMADRARWSLSPNGRGLLSGLFPAA